MKELLLSIVVLVSGATYSQDKNIDGVGKGGDAQRRNAKTTPVIVNILPPQMTPEEAESNKKEKEEKAKLDKELVSLTGDLAKYTDDLALFTKILAGVAVLQLLVFGYQGWMLRRTVDSTERTERAEIFVNDVKPQIFPEESAHKMYPGGKDAPWPRIHFSLTNFGRTSAVVTRIRTKMILCESLPVEPEYSSAVSQEGETVVSSGTTSKPFRETLERHLTADEITNIKGEKSHIFFFGHVKYKDIYGTKHVYAFCLQFHNRSGHPHGGVVSVAGGDAYNYRRIET